MKVILKQSVEKLGEAGDIVRVKPGYARNYLIPTGVADVASAANLRLMEEERRQVEERAKRDYLEARRRASQLKGAELVFEARAGEGGKLFGSVTNSDVAARLAEERELDFELDRRRVILEEPIKTIGVYEVTVRLHREVEVEVEVRVEGSEA